jgi:hypothetical protein
MLSALETAANRGKMGDALVKARFAVTSPMYEAGFEARHFQKDAEEQFWNYYNERGIQPTTDEVNAFASKMAGATNGVFMTNMAILAPSNLAMVGDLLNIKGSAAKWITSASDDVTRNVFRIGTEVGKDGTYTAMKAGFFNKAAAYVSPFVKGAVVEGLYEEGSQGIASNTFKNYVASSYNPEAMKSTANYIDSFGKAFQDQFSTKEGMEEIVIGALIGGLMGGVGGARSTSRQYKQQAQIADIQNAGTEFADSLRSNIYTNEQLLSLFSSANRFQDLRSKLEKANEQGNNLEEASLQAQSFISMLDSYHSVGKGAEFTDMIKNVFNGIDNQYVADSTGLNLNQVDAFKQEQIKDMDELANKYSTALEAGRYLFGNKVGGFTEVDGKKVNGQNLANALAFSSTMALFHEKYAAQNFDAFQNKLAQMNGSNDLIEKIGALGVIKKAGAIELQSYYTLNGEETKLKNDLNKIADKLNKIDASTEKTLAATERVELANKLIEIQAQIQDVTSNKDILWKSMVDNFYSKMSGSKYVPQIDLDTFTKQVNDISSSLERTNFSAEDKLVLNQLLDQFDQANTAYRSFSDMANKITDPNLSFKTFNHMFSGLRAKMDKSINEHTKETLLQLYGQGQIANTIKSNTFDSLQTTPSPITVEVLESQETPAEENIEHVSNKLKTKRVLSENEQVFYERFKDEIDNYRSIDIIDPLNSTSPATAVDDITIKINAVETQIQNLNNGIYSDELQTSIDNITETTPNTGNLTFEVTGEQGDIYTINVDENDVAVVKRSDGGADIEIIQMNQTVRDAVANKIAELRSGINTTASDDSAIIEKIEEERLRLEDQLAVLNGELSVEERRLRLQEEVNLLRNHMMVDESEEVDEVKVKRLVLLQRELDNIDNIKEPFNANGTPLEQLTWVINNISDLSFETVQDLAGITKPTQELVDEYLNLLNTRNRNSTQRKRLAELRAELLPFNLAEGLAIDGVNILDIISLYNQNKNIQDITNTQQAELPENDLKNINKDVRQVTDREEFRSAKVGLVYDGAYIERKKNGYRIYHVKLNSMLEQAINSGLTPEITVFDDQRAPVEVITITPENMQEMGNRFDGISNIGVKLSEEVGLSKSVNDKSFTVRGDLQALLTLLGATPYAITGQPTNYILLYKSNLDGSMQPREAEFSITNQGVELAFDKSVLNSIRPGDTVTLEFDRNDDYNKQLTSKEYTTKGRIYVKKNGKLVNILKGTDVEKSEHDNWAELQAIRKQTVKAGLAKTKKTVSIQVTNSYLGFPIITLNNDGSAREIPIDESQVVAYGYMDETGNLQGDIANTKIDNIQYITPLSTMGKKTPVVAFKAYGQVIAFPINVKPKGVDLTADVDIIINNDNLSRERKYLKLMLF